MRLFSFLILISVLFGGVLSPLMAHYQDFGVEHVGEVLDVHEPALSTAHDPADKSPDMPGQPAAHHHCTIALEAYAPTLFAVHVVRNAEHSTAISRVLASYAQAPPTQPPAA